MFLTYQVYKVTSLQEGGKKAGREGGRGTNERPGNGSCDLRVNERPKKNCIQRRKQTDKRTWNSMIELAQQGRFSENLYNNNWYRGFYTHQLRESVSPGYRIFIKYFIEK